jgi:VacB/RNase II family 3'-5' exoribonuclease
MANPIQSHRLLLAELARQAMLERELLPDFSPEAQAEAIQMTGPVPVPDGKVRDLRGLLWSSIDNDESRDLDQLSVAEKLDGKLVKILVAIADVDVLVKPGMAINAHAMHNTTSVYTPAVIFPMLPERLSTDLTSLNPDVDRYAMVVDMTFAADGSLIKSDVYQAVVRSKTKLAYNSVAAWLEGGNMPSAVSAVPGLSKNLRLQDQVAQKVKVIRHRLGALSLESIQGEPVFKGDQIVALVPDVKNRATELIENLMIAANGVTARFLSSHGYPSIRRVVHSPKRWDRIVELAAQHGYKLPGKPDPRALEQFLVHQKAADLLRFPDLSLAVIKLIGPGEYAAEPPTDREPDHFSLAARDYTHSTAPNRRFPDLITQRMLKAAVDGLPAPYSMSELVTLAAHCTQQEDEANKVERQVNKSAAALLLESHIGEQFDAIVTGASPKGTWVRLLSIPVEGRLASGFEGVDVGDKVRVKLVSVDIEQGFIDFRKVSRAR